MYIHTIHEQLLEVSLSGVYISLCFLWLQASDKRLPVFYDRVLCDVPCRSVVGGCVSGCGL